MKRVAILLVVLLAGLACAKPSLEETGTAELVLIEGGTFLLGNVYQTDEGADYELPVSRVTLSDYLIGKYEVSWTLWVKVRDWALENGYDFEYPGSEGSDYGAIPREGEQAVAMVSWYDTVKWCNAYSEIQGFKPCYYLDAGHKTLYKKGNVDLSAEQVAWNSGGYRLPTEAEWEYAAKDGQAGIKNTFRFAGENDPDIVAWYEETANLASQPIGLKAPNRLGLYDMSGNLQEWCFDWSAEYTADDKTNPRGPASPRSSNRIIRGGSYLSEVEYLHLSFRYDNGPDNPGLGNGFRVVRAAK